MSETHSRFLDLQALAALQHMRFSTKHRVEGPFSGRHESRRRGGAGEFVDFREYSDGEDLRRLDWKVLARTGRAYIRLYQDETNLSCILAVDASGSMRFGLEGSDSKLEYVQYLSTALSHVISGSQDQVGLALISGGLRDVLAPGSTPGHVRHMQSLIEKIETEPETDLANALRDLFERQPRRGVLVVLSDFLVERPEEAFASIRLFRHRGWEVVALHVVHPEEESLPEGHAYRFEGLENEGAESCTPHEIREAYQELFETHVSNVRSLALAAGCDYRRVSTSVPYLETLAGFLVERSG
jgi:uncharacterized protein (DUF58 family)